MYAKLPFAFSSLSRTTLRSVVRLSVRFRCCRIALISGLPSFEAWMRGREYFPPSKSEQKPWFLVFYDMSAIFAENADGGVGVKPQRTRDSGNRSGSVYTVQIESKTPPYPCIYINIRDYT